MMDEFDCCVVDVVDWDEETEYRIVRQVGR